ncbi:MAG: segregation/condensation protein A [Vulcanimicrobiota bacterium]
MAPGFQQHAVKSNYQVSLPQFEGPLDLLLHLVDDEKLPLNEISLAAVAQQYQAYLKTLEQLDVEIESSYIVVFSQLLELKSKLLLPPEPTPMDLYEEDFCPAMAGDDFVEDAPNELLDQLQAYRLVKDAADWLYNRETRSLAQYSRPAGMHEVDCPELDVSLEALAATWVRMDRKYEAPRRPVELRRVVLSVPDRVKQLWEMLRRNPRTFFHDVLNGDWNKAFIIVTFLAVLELVRRSRVTAQQDSVDGDIVLSPYAGATDMSAPETAEEYR